MITKFVDVLMVILKTEILVLSHHNEDKKFYLLSQNEHHPGYLKIRVIRRDKHKWGFVKMISSAR